jgi:hypothetical protein
MAAMREKISTWLERRRAQTLVDSLEQWHETCVNVTQICAQALLDQATVEGDIGEVLDGADRKLYAFRNHMTEARREINRHDPILARRITQVTEDVYRLRNQTARFLIRAQGPHPFAGGRLTEENLRNAYYYKALEEAGFQGREIAERLQRDTDTLWHDLQTLLIQAQKALQI